MTRFIFVPATSTSTYPALSEELEAASVWLQTVSAGDWAWLGVAIHITLTVFMIVRILSTQRNNGIAIAWLVLLFAIPF
nr:hypothetical protein [Psychrobacter sp. PraFG1]UNK06154.1 hypothetical protein MN210_05900 [Psychrobacter sp. PraFG1]